MDESTKKSSIKNYALFFLIVFIQLLRIILIFTNEKDGKHPDESWSFGLANSYYRTHIFMTDDGSEETYDNEWVSGKVLKDYITVDQEHRFAYDSVIHNMRYDAHPPLFFMILHTICSFFPDTYNFWFAFSINIVSFILIQIFLYKLSKKMFGNETAALAVIIFYGFSVAGVSTIIYTRQYALLTVFTVMSVYFHRCMLEAENRKSYVKWLIGIMVATFLGAMTHYFFLPFAFAISLLFCFGYIIKKKPRKLLIYGASLLASVLLTMPFTNMSSFIGTSKSSGSSVAQAKNVLKAGLGGYFLNIINQLIDIAFYPDFEKRVNISLDTILYDFFGIKHYVSIPYLPLFIVMIITLFAIIWFGLSFLLRYLLRENQESKLFLAADKTVSYIKKVGQNKFIWIVMIAASIMVFWFVLGFASPVSMQQYTNRYLFMIYPFLVLLLLKVILFLVKRVCSLFDKKKDDSKSKQESNNITRSRIAAVVLSLVCVVDVASAKSIYLFPRPDYEPKLEEICKGKDVVLLLSQHWLLTSYTTLLYDADEIFVSLTEGDEYRNYMTDLRKADSDEVILAVDATDYELVMKNKKGDDYAPERNEIEAYYLNFFEECYPERNIEFLYVDKEARRNIYIYSAK